VVFEVFALIFGVYHLVLDIIDFTVEVFYLVFGV